MEEYCGIMSPIVKTSRSVMMNKEETCVLDTEKKGNEKRDPQRRKTSPSVAKNHPGQLASSANEQNPDFE
ncbi:hypothetical protein E2320_013381 [Naja naja]|nr:hypothetical protein E2320_013381 [Naja naja]